ncbi:MAG: hypothetical protein ACTSO9_02580 [Candidatus Helarchaeota archaeon]
MNKKIILALLLITGCLVAVIPLAFLGLPFPSGNPDGFEKATFEDSRVGEPESSVLPGIDLGKFGDFILGPLGIVLAFLLTIGLFYFLRKMPDIKGQPKFLVFAIFAIILICLLVIPFMMASSKLQWKSSISVDQDNIWTFSMESATLDGKKYSLETSNGTTTFALEFSAAGITHSIEVSSDSGEIGYTASITYHTAAGPSYTLSLSKDETKFSVELAPTEEETYTLEIVGNEVTFTAQIVSNDLTLTLEQAGNELGYSVGIDL